MWMKYGKHMIQAVKDTQHLLQNMHIVHLMSAQKSSHLQYPWIGGQWLQANSHQLVVLTVHAQCRYVYIYITTLDNLLHVKLATSTCKSGCWNTQMISCLSNFRVVTCSCKSINLLDLLTAWS